MFRLKKEQRVIEEHVFLLNAAAQLRTSSSVSAQLPSIPPLPVPGFNIMLSSCSATVHAKFKIETRKLEHISTPPEPRAASGRIRRSSGGCGQTEGGGGEEGAGGGTAFSAGGEKKEENSCCTKITIFSYSAARLCVFICMDLRA